MPAGLQRIYGQGHMHFIYVQLLPAAAVVEDRASPRHFRQRAGKSARRDEVSFGRLCGDAGARASAAKRTAAANTLGGVAEIEGARGTEIAKAQKSGERGAIAIAV